MKYDSFTFLYPPRPEAAVKPTSIGNYPSDRYLAQPKLNGSCATLYVPPKHDRSEFLRWQLWDRHKTVLPCRALPFEKLATDGWNVFAGEYMNKSKRGEDGAVFNHKFVIWDLLVYDGLYLTQCTFEERYSILTDMMPCDRTVINPNGNLEMNEYICTTCYEDIYRAMTFEKGDYADLYNRVVKTDMYEGLVLKRRNAKLESGYRPENNTGWQVKCRKPTKLYNH